MYFGIDFGTTYSVCSIFSKEKPAVLPALFGDKGEPTVMFYTGDRWLYGGKAEKASEFCPSEAIRNIKTQIRDGGELDKPATSSGYTLSFRELMKNYLCWLIKEGKKKAVENGGIEEEEIDGITVTVPCGFAGRGMAKTSYGEAIREAVIAAYHDVINSGVALAGVGTPSIHVLEEPVAAAMDFLKSAQGKKALDKNPEMNVLVADLGGGTFDVTVIKCVGRRDFTVTAKEGDLHLGGNYFDEALLNLVLSKAKKADPRYVHNDSNRAHELRQAREIKEILSESENAQFSSFDRSMPNVQITRTEFENATSALLERIKKVIKKCVDCSGGISKIDKIVLVGGASRMPQIKKGILSMYPSFNEDNIVFNKPSYAIANGAAYFCQAKERGRVDVKFSEAIVLNDMATCSYGTDYGNEEYHIYNMILKGQSFINGKIEVVGDTSFSAVNNDQSQVAFRIFESEENQTRVSYNGLPYNNEDQRFNSNGLCVTIDIPPEYKHRAKEYSMVPKLILNSDGILKLEVYREDEDQEDSLGELIGEDQIRISN